MAGAEWILWAEDDRNDQRLIHEALAEAAITVPVRFAGDGSAALAALRESGPLPSRVVLDLRMGPMDGLPALRKIRSDPRLADLDVVVFTSGQVDNEREEVLRLGARFEVKPSEFSAFASLVQRIADLQEAAADQGPPARAEVPWAAASARGRRGTDFSPGHA